MLRLLFAVGASASASMITAILAEISTFRVSGRKLVRSAYRQTRARLGRLLRNTRNRNGSQARVTFGGPNGLSISANHDDDISSNPYTSVNSVSNNNVPYQDDAPQHDEHGDSGSNNSVASGNETDDENENTKATLAENPAPSEPSPWVNESSSSSSMGMQPYEFNDNINSNATSSSSYSPADYDYYDQDDDEEEAEDHHFTGSGVTSDDGFLESVQPGTRNGRGAAVVGVMAGLGACFGAFVLVALPVYLRLNHNVKTTASVLISYTIVGAMSVTISILLFFGLHNDRAKKVSYWITGRIPESERVALGVHTEAEQQNHQHQEQSFSSGAITDSLKLSYFQLLRQGFSIAFDDARIALAYGGSFVARSTSVCTVMFIPLLVAAAMNRQNGSACWSNVPASELTGSCKRGYILSFSVMGVAQTSALLTAPLWGFAADKFGRRASLIAACVVGVVAFSAFGFFGTSAAESIIYFDKDSSQKGVKLLSSSSLAGAPGSSITILYLFGALMGVSQIGTVITSMSLVTDTRRAASGSIAGVYSFCGGSGILVLSFVGGKLSDWFAGMPFLLIAVFNVGLLLMAAKQVPSVANVLSWVLPGMGPSSGNSFGSEGRIRLGDDDGSNNNRNGYGSSYNGGESGSGAVSKVKSFLQKMLPRRVGNRIQLGNGDRSDANFINYED